MEDWEGVLSSWVKGTENQELWEIARIDGYG